MKINFLLLLLLFFGRENRTNFIYTSDGIKMYYEKQGSGDLALILVHGWSANSIAWVEQMDYFKKDYQVIVPDLPGFGKSGTERKDWTMEQYGDDIATLANKLKLDQIVLVGWSMGGPVVLEVAKKLRTKIKVIILVDILQQLTNPFDSVAITDYNLTYAANFNNYQYILNYYKGDHVLTKRYLSLMPPGNKMPGHWKKSWLNLHQWMDRKVKEGVKAIQAPIRAINADETETNTAEWKQFARDFEVTVFENSNHFLVWQYPEKFNNNICDIIKKSNHEKR